MIEQLRVAAKLLRPGGHLIVLQPNVRLVGPRYWDFIDHRVALTERSLLEAAELAHLRTVELDPALPSVLDERASAHGAGLGPCLPPLQAGVAVHGPPDAVRGNAGVSEPKPTTAPELAIVLPVYNEGEAVEPVLRALSAGVATSHELVVVYDFDGDTTVPVVERLANEIAGLRSLAERPRTGRSERDESGHRRDDLRRSCSSRWPMALMSHASSTRW